MNKKKWICLIIIALIFIISGFIIGTKYKGSGFNYIGLGAAGILIIFGGIESFRDWLNR